MKENTSSKESNNNRVIAVPVDIHTLKKKKLFSTIRTVIRNVRESVADGEV